MTVPAFDHTKLLNAAREWHDAGFCVVPSHEDGGKRPFGAWKKYQAVRPTWDELSGWLVTGRYTGIGLIMGSVSGNSEMLELEGPQNEMQARLDKVIAEANRLREGGIDDLVKRVLHGFMETSAGGGLHTLIRVTDGPALGNTKLAHDGDKVIAETRGEGGFVIVYPTAGRKGHEPGTAYMLGQGKPSTVAEVTSEERDVLHAVFTLALHNHDVDLEPASNPEPVKAQAPTPLADVSEGVSPFDDYRQRTSWRQILEPAGWRHHSSDAEHDYWVRPGKDPRDGHSASTIEDGPFYLFSTSVEGIPREVGLSKGQVYAYLQHNGDLSQAGKALRASGYGSDTYVLPSWSPEASLKVDFYAQHPTLAAIRQAAHARLVSADAVLACVLARVTQHIPWEYALPPIIGGKASPNLFVALIGPSGTGKGGARRAADELLGIRPDPQRPENEGPLGSGEGIVSLFYGNKPADPDDPESKSSKTLEFFYRNVMIIDEEGSGLADLLKRQGQLTEPTLLKMWSGEPLGMSYSARSSAVQLKVPGDEYRAAALLGIQPAAAAFMLDQARSDRGLPQRFLWASTIDPSLTEDELTFPGTINWKPPTFRQALDATLIVVDPEIRQQLRRAQIGRVNGTGSLGLDSHSGLVRLKAATALAALLRPGQPLEVDLDTWALAGQLTEASDKVRLAVARQAQADRDKVIQHRQDVAVRQQVAVKEVNAKVKNCAKTIQKHIERKHAEEGEYCTKSCARRAMASQYREVFDAALEAAIELEWVADITDDDGEIRHFGLGESRPA